MSTVDGSEPCLVGSCGRKLLGDLCPAHNDDKLCLGGATGVLPLTTCAACFLWVHHPHCVRKGETRLRPRKEATHAVLAQCSSRQSVLRGVAGREPLLCCCGPLVFFFFFFLSCKVGGERDGFSADHCRLLVSNSEARQAAGFLYWA